jgi:lipopolysaccharide export system protein LptA
MRLTLSRPRFTIERLRTLVLVGGVLLVAAIVIFLAAGQWTRRFLSKDLPNRLGINIEQQADGVNYTQTRKGKTIFKIHAARAVTMKTGGKTLLHDVKIDLYGDDGNRADTISGSEFEYDTNAGVATAAGAVEITMMRPGEKPAITQLKPGNSKPRPSAAKPEARKAPAANSAPGSVSTPVNAALANQITDNQIHVKTSGLVFNQKTGVATTTQRVDFALRQGNGNSIGATYDSQNGQLILDRAVELHVERDGGPITVHAGHAEFEHSQMVCRLSQAKAEYTGGTAQTATAVLHFRADGSAIQLDGSGGVDLQTKTGGHVTAPLGTLQFDENNHPRHGLLQGGAHLEMNQPNRQVQGSSPTARLTFDNAGQLTMAHMEEGVLFSSQQQATTAKGAVAEIHRTWKSQTADVAFAPAAEAHEPGRAAATAQAKGQVQTQAQNRIEPRTIHGYGGVVVTSESTSDGVATPSKLSSDTMVAELAPGGALSSLQGTGHASFDERTAAGVHQASTADQLDVRFVPVSISAPKAAMAASTSKSQGAAGGSEIASMVEIGHVVLVQDPAPVHSGQPAQKSSLPEAQSGLRATANRADYDGPSQLLHLTGSPRVRDGALDMTADRIDFARATGDAFAHGDVRASWIGGGAQQGPTPNVSLPGASLLSSDRPGSSGNGPVHAIAAEAELHQVTQEVVFRGAENFPTGHSGIQPRLWQSVNSVVAPVIVLNRQKMTLTAEAHGAANPVRTVLVSNAPAPSSAKSAPGSANSKEKHEDRSVIRVSSGDLHYSEGERLALFHSGSVGSVTAETTGTGGTATIVSQEAEVNLLPQGVHSASATTPAASAPGSGNASGQAHSPANSSIDRLTARGHVTVDWPDRRGTGEKLVYLSEDGTYTLTGTSSAPPRIVDQARGTVTGSALIYHSGDESVTVQSDGGKTETETRSKK